MHSHLPDLHRSLHSDKDYSHIHWNLKYSNFSERYAEIGQISQVSQICKVCQKILLKGIGFCRWTCGPVLIGMDQMKKGYLQFIVYLFIIIFDAHVKGWAGKARSNLITNVVLIGLESAITCGFQTFTHFIATEAGQKYWIWPFKNSSGFQLRNVNWF